MASRRRRRRPGLNPSDAVCPSQKRSISSKRSRRPHRANKALFFVAKASTRRKYRPGSGNWNAAISLRQHYVSACRSRTNRKPPNGASLSWSAREPRLTAPRRTRGAHRREIERKSGAALGDGHREPREQRRRLIDVAPRMRTSCVRSRKWIERRSNYRFLIVSRSARPRFADALSATANLFVFDPMRLKPEYAARLSATGRRSSMVRAPGL